MEATEVLVEVYTPGVMEAGLTSWIFWAGMLLVLTAGFIAAYPVSSKDHSFLVLQPNNKMKTK